MGSRTGAVPCREPTRYPDRRGTPGNRSAQRDSGRSAGNRKSRSKAARERRALAGIDASVSGTHLAYFVLVPTAALLLLGLVMVFSAGSAFGVVQGGSGYRLFAQQAAWAGLGLMVMIFFAKFDYHKLGKVSWIGVLVSVGLLVVVLVIGKDVGGARRWLELGPLSLQPTEIAKFTVVVFCAYALATKGRKARKFAHLAVPVLFVTVVVATLIMLQPDLGSSIVLCLSVMLVIALSQARLSHLGLIGAVGAATAVYFMLSASYRRSRLFSFINPWNSPRGYGYQVIQSYIALGSGNIKGLGLGMSRQKFLYLPNAHTDFIFAIIGEELGLLGTMTVVVLIALFTLGGFRIAGRAPDELGKLLAAGITGLIVIQAMVNMGGVTGLLPITGVPLPLVSFGGSSLCVCMGCIGILLNIASQRSR